MALNFGVLDQGGPSNFFEGYSQGQEKMQANAMAQQKTDQAQQEFGMRQQEFAAGQADKQRVAKAAAVTQKLASYEEAFLKARTPDDARRLIKIQYDDPDIGPIRSRLGPLEQALAEVPDEPSAFQNFLNQEAMGIKEFRKQQYRQSQVAGLFGDGGAVSAPGSTNAMIPAGATPQAASVANTMAPAAPNVADLVRRRNQALALGETAVATALNSDIARLSPAAPTSIAEFERAKTDPAFMKFLQERRPPGTTVVLPPQEKAFEGGLGKGQSDRILANQVVAQDAAAILETNQIGRDLLKSGAITGTGANFLVGFNNALKQAGVDFGYADAASNSQAYAAAMGANVGRIIKQFGAGTGLSDADREYAAQIAGGKIGLTEASLRKILDINDRVANRIIDLHNKNVSGIKTNIPLTVQKPVGIAPPPAAASQIPTNVAPSKPAAATLAPADKQALDWANSNPKDPRALQIKQRLGQ